MKYAFMITIAFCLAIISSIMTALGMTELFAAAGTFILVLFVLIDLGRFLLFNFVVDEWHNLRKVKYLIVVILTLLFAYSAVGIFAKLDSLVSTETKSAMINAAAYNKAVENAEVTQNRSEDLAVIAQKEYKNALEWNALDYNNCISRAAGDINKENKCNNTKRRLDKTALANLQTALKSADSNLKTTEETTKINSQNQSEIASILTTICKLTQKDCTTYDSLQNSISILIFLVIIGTDYLQIAIILAVNTRKNKLKVEDHKKVNFKQLKVTHSVEEPTKKIEKNAENFLEVEKTDKGVEIPRKTHSGGSFGPKPRPSTPQNGETKK